MKDREDPRTRIEELGQRFTCLANAPGITPFDARMLDEWAASDAPSPAQHHAACFILGVWDSGTAWKAGPFLVMEALAAWDYENRLAFLCWANSPWWA